MLALPIVGTDACLVAAPGRARRSALLLRLRAAGAHALGDAIYWDDEAAEYRTGRNPASRAFVRAKRRVDLVLTGPFTSGLLDMQRTPLSGPPWLPFSKLEVAGDAVHAYSPKRGRLFMQGELELPPRVDRWLGREAAADGQPATMLSWRGEFTAGSSPSSGRCSGSCSTARSRPHGRRCTGGRMATSCARSAAWRPRRCTTTSMGACG